ncbi:hypothetical protein [Achromobacter aloeverae]|nr:hypothetical protein [Achromobacter aloeverae]
MMPARPTLLRAAAVIACTALLCCIFIAWQDPSITLALMDGFFLCH